MKRKLTKATLSELELHAEIMNLFEQKGIVGGGDGSTYSMEEYLSMVANGSWAGGYVEGLGTVGTSENVYWNSNGSTYVGSSTSGSDSYASSYDYYAYGSNNGYGSGYDYGSGCSNSVSSSTTVSNPPTCVTKTMTFESYLNPKNTLIDEISKIILSKIPFVSDCADQVMSRITSADNAIQVELVKNEVQVNDKITWTFSLPIVRNGDDTIGTIYVRYKKNGKWQTIKQMVKLTKLNYK